MCLVAVRCAYAAIGRTAEDLDRSILPAAQQLPMYPRVPGVQGGFRIGTADWAVWQATQELGEFNRFAVTARADFILNEYGTPRGNMERTVRHVLTTMIGRGDLKKIGPDRWSIWPPTQTSPTSIVIPLSPSSTEPPAPKPS